MVFFQAFLWTAALAVGLIWAAITAYLLVVERNRRAARANTARAVAALEAPDLLRLPLVERLARTRPLLGAVSRDMLMHAAADRATEPETFAVLAAYLSEPAGHRSLLQDAASHQGTREKWRRTTALRILFRQNHPDVMRLLVQASDDRDSDLAGVAFALLGQSADPHAIDVLIDALRGKKHPASRVAVHLEQSALLTADRLKPLLADADAVVRLWGATLLARYPEPDVEYALAPLCEDADPRVRKAAIRSLGSVGDVLATDCADRLLRDQVPYVRAHAARALGHLGQVDLADKIVALLGDRDWWVRKAAKDALETLGTETWPVVMRNLNHKDRFVRNGSAEVLQNLGILDSLIVMEAASDNPAEAKIAMLRRIASAGGVRFTDSLVDRAGPVIGPRIRSLLATIGMERVEAL